MSSAIFPTRWPPTATDNSLTPYLVPDSIRKVPFGRTAVLKAASGAEYRVAPASIRYRYEFRLEGLDATALGVVRDFFAARLGTLDSFQLEDPDSHTLVQVRFDMDELEFDQVSPALWGVSLYCMSVVGTSPDPVAPTPTQESDFSSAQVKATSASTLRTLAARAADILSPLDNGAAGNGSTNDSAAWTATFALATSGKVVDGAGRSYRLNTAITVPAGVTVRNAAFVAGTAGMNVLLVSTGSSLLGVKVTGTGTTSTVERAIYPATDGASDVTLDVEVTNLTVGVHAQPLTSAYPARWKGRVYAHDIVGTTGSSEGYGVLLSPAESCRLEVVATDIKRHAVYLSAGARYNEITVDVDGCGNGAVQLYSTYTQPSSRNNTVRGRMRGLYVPSGQAAGQVAGVYVLANCEQNVITVDVDGEGTAEFAVVVEGDQVTGRPLPTATQITGCRIRGEFIGANVIKDVNGESTVISGNDVRAYATSSVIALRRAGTTDLVYGPSVYDNEIDALSHNIYGVYDEVTAGPTFVGRNRIRNTGSASRVNDATSGKRSGNSREFYGQTSITCSGGNGAYSQSVSWPEDVANPRVSATAVSFSVSGVGSFPAYATSVTTSGASINVYNGNASAQTITVDWVVRGD